MFTWEKQGSMPQFPHFQSAVATILEKGHGNPLQDSCLGRSLDKGAWQATVHEVAKSRA